MRPLWEALLMLDSSSLDAVVLPECVDCGAEERDDPRDVVESRHHSRLGCGERSRENEHAIARWRLDLLNIYKNTKKADSAPTTGVRR